MLFKCLHYYLLHTTHSCNPYTNAYLCCIFPALLTFTFQTHVYVHVSLATSTLTPTLTCLVCLSPCTFQPHVYVHFSNLYLACFSCSLQSTTTPTLTCIACSPYLLLPLLNLMPTYMSYTSISLFVLQSASLALLFEPYHQLNISCTCFSSLSSIFEPLAALYHVPFPCSFSSMLVFDAALALCACFLHLFVFICLLPLCLMPSLTTM